MGPRPSSEYSLDRHNNSLPYSKDNCRWATREEQANNKTTNVVLTFNGRTQTVTQWARELKIPENTLRNRLYRGWTVEKALQY